MCKDNTKMNESSQKNRDLVRELARKVAQIAASPEQAVVTRRWCDVNAMRKPDRYPVWCRPVGAWDELLPKDSLQTQDPWAKKL